MCSEKKIFSRVGLFALLAVFATACFGSHEDITSGTGPLASDEPEERFIVHVNDYGAGLAAIHAAGGEVRLEIESRGLVSVALPDGALAALRRSPAVDSIERDQVRRPMAESIPWGIRRVQADLLDDGTPGTKMVCIIDGGYYLGHEDLPTAHVTGEPDGWDTSECPHGTHVAGTIAAVGHNDLGVIGVNPSTIPIYAVQVFGGTDCGWVYSSTLVAAVQACVAAGADVINMSLGGGGFSTAEDDAFSGALADGVLSFAAAGNDSTTGLSYPASYDSVVSVGATDDTDARADFSQHNAQVEVSAPGVGVLSTVQYQANNDLTVGGATYEGGSMEGSIDGDATGPLVDGGDCNTRPSRNAYRGQIVLCRRGGETFRTKADNVNRGGAAGMLVYNNVPGSFGGTLGSGRAFNFPMATLSQAQGQDAVANHLGEDATLHVLTIAPASGYDTYDGTSMATPHAAGVAALVWHHAETALGRDVSPQEIRTALGATGLDPTTDPATDGRDDSFGYGIVQAADALAYLTSGTTTHACVAAAGQEVTETDCANGIDDDCDGTVDADDSDCAGGSSGGGTTCGDLALPGDSCDVDADCCLNVCRGKPGAKSCR